MRENEVNQFALQINTLIVSQTWAKISETENRKWAFHLKMAFELWVCTFLFNQLAMLTKYTFLETLRMKSYYVQNRSRKYSVHVGYIALNEKKIHMKIS